MIDSVSWLDVESHKVRLCDGMMLEGIIIGNNAIPAVSITLAIETLDNTKANPERWNKAIIEHKNKLATPAAGTNQSRG